MEGRLGLELAQRIVEEAKKKAEELHIKEDIALVDAGGNLKAFVRMDGAWLGSIDIAIRKARTARLFDMETAKIGKMSQPGEPLYGIEFSNGGLISFGGGIPLEDQAGTVIGAIGVSGSTT
ncbi:MAG: GlcG/HbpS family heme-binding protein [Candidatus Acidiferrales bacterium]